MRSLIVITLLFASSCLHAQNQPTFEQAWKDAQNGNPNACLWIGYFYLQGEGITCNYSEAIKWLKKAADNRIIASYGCLGICYFRLQNYQEAINWLKKAIDNGDTQAYGSLGKCYFRLQNYQEAINWLKKAIDNGDAQAYGWLGICYAQLQNYQEAINWLKKDIDNGDTQAYGSLGSCYSELQNYQEAINWLKKAIDNGDTQAYGSLASCYGQLQNYQEAINWLKKAIDNGDTQAYGNLGSYYVQLQNYQEAINWLKKAIDNGDTQAYGDLGYCYAQLQNYQEAINWLKKAIDNGDTIAYVSLGSCYVQLQNYQEAINWLKKAIDNGVIEASINICYAYYMTNNYVEAKKWANTIINQKGNAFMGYRILSLLNMYGLGVPKNKDKAFEFIAKAIDAAQQEGGPMPSTLDVEGELYLADNNISKAREIYKKILKETPDFYTQKETKLSKFMKEHKGCDVDIDIPIANNVSNYTFAVIISNEKYQMEKSVQYAENDGKMFTEYCKKTLGLPEKNVRFITNATLNNIKHEIKWLQDVIAVYKGEAKAIFYYAGHGIPDEQNKSAYLLPIDGYGSDVTTGYALEDLYKALGSLPSKSVTVFLDACFSGAKRDGDMLASARGVAIKVKQNNPTGNMVVFTAAQGDETAYPYKDEGHGLFTYYLLKKLQETKGDVTLGELGDYIKTQVERQSIVTNGKLQSPAILSASSIGNSWKEWKLNK